MPDREHTIGQTVPYATLAGVLDGLITGYTDTLGGPGYELTFPGNRWAVTTDRAIERLRPRT